MTRNKRTALSTSLGMALWLGIAVDAQVASQRPAPPPQSDSSSLSRMPAPVRAEVERLMTDDEGKRASAAMSLGEMGARASDAVPWLIALATDSRNVLALSRGRTTVAEVSVSALKAIDPNWAQVLRKIASDPKESLRRQAVVSIGLAGDSALAEFLVTLYRATAGPLPEQPAEGDYAMLMAIQAAMGCYPDVRVAEAVLDVAAMPVRRPEDKFNSALSTFRDLVGKYEYQGDLKTPEAARSWWAANQSTTKLVKVGNCSR